MNKTHWITNVITGVVAASAIATVIPAQVRAQNSELDYLCQNFPHNSRCKGYSTKVSESGGDRDAKTGFRVIALEKDWRSRDADVPWSEPVIVKNSVSGDELVVFDKDYGSSFGGYGPKIETGIVTKWSSFEIGVFAYKKQSHCGLFGLVCQGVDKEAYTVGRTLEVEVGGNTYRLYGKEGNFPVSGELAIALHNAPEDKAALIVTLPGGQKVKSHIGVKTVKAWKAIYTPEQATGQSYQIAAVPSASTPLSLEQVTQKSLPYVVGIQNKQGRGAGFLIDGTGLIITNRHIVKAETQPTIEFSDGSTKTAQVLERDSLSDLAILRVEGKPGEFQGLPICHASSANLGEEVVAVGKNTITKGIVSGLTKLDSKTLIQLNTTLNPEYSGGPLLNKYGSVIGIVNTNITGETEGMAFAMPIDEAFKRLGVSLKVSQGRQVDTCGSQVVQP